HPEGKRVIISGRKRLLPHLQRFINTRSKIEPVIEHLKAEHRLGINFLRGMMGDVLNPLFAAAAFNLRKILRSFFFYFFFRYLFHHKPELLLVNTSFGGNFFHHPPFSGSTKAVWYSRLKGCLFQLIGLDKT
ncbi:MAG: hypothetical protein RMK80_04955, partial [Pseudobdellovibrionaceae bacterium]|nr:hypothetical protein [Pseudobdellovibrionaceae bacterium]